MIHNRKMKFILFIMFIVLFTGMVSFGADNNPTIVRNIEFINADLRDVFRSLAEIGKYSVILDSAVNADVTLTLRYGVTIKDAIGLIAKTYGYNCRWLADSDTVVIGNSKFINGNFDRKISKIFQLKYSDPVTVADALEVVITKSRIKTDLKANQIIVTANDLEIQNITEIIAKLDRETSTINVETKMAEVTGQFWKEIGVDNTFSPPHMGIYLLTESQLKALEDKSKLNIIAKPNLSSLDGHEGKMFLGDKIPIITEKNKQGDINYKVEYTDAGTNLSFTPLINYNNKLTIKVKASVNTITNKANPGENWIPWVVTREFESTIRLVAGQAFIISGLLQRNEYNMMKESPYNFPVLSEMFKKENPFIPIGYSAPTEVILLVTPEFTPKLDVENNRDSSDTSSNSRARNDDEVGNNKMLPIDSGANPDQVSGTNQTDSVNLTNQSATVYEKPALEESKPEIQPHLVDGKVSANKNDFQAVNENQNGQITLGQTSYTDIPYLVKKGDSLASIVKKFDSNLQIIIDRNKLGSKGIIKTNTIILVPVPNERLYTLKQKETLWRISKRYGTTLAVLKDLNGIVDEKKVNAGQAIVLPGLASKIINPQF